MTLVPQWSVVEANITHCVDGPPSLEPHTNAALMAQPYELGLRSRWDKPSGLAGLCLTLARTAYPLGQSLGLGRLMTQTCKPSNSRDTWQKCRQTPATIYDQIKSCRCTQTELKALLHTTTQTTTRFMCRVLPQYNLEIYAYDVASIFLRGFGF